MCSIDIEYWCKTSRVKYSIECSTEHPIVRYVEKYLEYMVLCIEYSTEHHIENVRNHLLGIYLMGDGWWVTGVWVW